MTPSNFSLDQIEKLLSDDPDMQDFLLRKTANNYDSFVNILYKDFQEIIRKLTHERHRYQHSECGEDYISSQIIISLHFLGYDAEHDTQHGGHCDILVKHKKYPFEWIGEAKLWKGQKYILDGLNQLLSRYASATSGENCGGIIVYVKQPLAYKKLATWHDTLSKEQTTLIINPLQGNELVFDSVQESICSGLEYKVRHFFVPMYHDTSTEPEYDFDGNALTA